MSKKNNDKTEKYLMSLTKQMLVRMLMNDANKLQLLESNKNKDQRIAELEKELAKLKANAILPKFKVGQEVWYTAERGYKPVPPIYCNKVDHIIVRKNGRDEFVLSYKIKHHIKDDLFQIVSMTYLYATEQEAQQKLKELEGK